MAGVTVQGGCQCGGVRYRVQGIGEHRGLCHCTSCRKVTGSPMVAWVTFPSAGFTLLQGAPTRFAASSRAWRSFCPACGTPLTYQRVDSPQSIDVTTCSLDEPGAFAPEQHIWMEDALPWVDTLAALPRHAQEAPEPAAWQLRVATRADVPRIAALLALSVRALGAADYTVPQIERALQGTFGVDTQLIDDQTYFVVEEAGEMVAAGGWSRRATLFGGDTRADRDATLLDPQADAARIRAFYVHPRHTRRGMASALLAHCEAQALAQGFRRCALMSTVPGLPLYTARGYGAQPPVDWPMGDGLHLCLIPMERPLS